MKVMGAAQMLSPGTTIAGYRIDGVLGEGGMGVVYEATQLSLDRKVALKVLTARLGEDDGFKLRFRREGRIQAAIDHPSIVTVHEAGESDEGLFLAMRLVRGRTLKELIAAQALSTPRALRILRPIAEALDAAHKAGLIHRDVKPHNILVGDRDIAYLGDFGLTKSPDDANLTRSGEFLGTPNYISPEQVHGDSATSASDVYALGAVLFECLTGVVPFHKTSNAAVLYAHVSAAPPRVTGLRPDLPPEIDAVVTRAMAKDPADRHPSATALLQDAEAALAGVEDLFRVPVAAPGVEIGAESLTVLDAPDGRITARLGNGTAVTAPGPLPRPDAGTGRTAPSRTAPSRAVLSGAAAIGVAVLVAAVAGFLLSRAGGDGQGERAVTALGLTLTVPAQWGTADPPAELADAGLTGATALAPESPGGAGLVAGRGALADTPLLPTGLQRAVADVPTPERVRLAGGEAYRYADMRLRSSSLPVTAFVLPTTAGAAIVVCHGPADASAFAASCERAAGTLKTTDGRVVALGPSAAYAKAINRSIARLDARRLPARKRLASATTLAAGQASAAERVSAAFSRTRKELGGRTAPAGGGAAHKEVRRALDKAARAYARLRSAAAAKSKAGFAKAARDIDDAEAGVADALSRLRRLGYRAV